MAISGLSASERTTRIRFERPVADDSFDGAGADSWEPVAVVWVQLQDKLPSRAEAQAGGFTASTLPVRIRMLPRAGITADMRICVLRKVGGVETVTRLLQIVSGPVGIGAREGLELMAEDYRPAGAV